VNTRAPIQPGNGGTSSTATRRRRTSRPRGRRAGDDRDTTVRVDGPAGCLCWTVPRTASVALRRLPHLLLICALASCTGTVPNHPDSPAPQTPTSSSNGGSPDRDSPEPSQAPRTVVKEYELEPSSTPCEMSARRLDPLLIHC